MKPGELKFEAEAARRLLAELAQLDGDEQAQADAIEGETSLMEAVTEAIKQLDEIDIQKAGLKIVIDGYQARVKMLNDREAAIRARLLDAMRTVGKSKLPTPLATLSVKAVAPKLVITDDDKIPAEYWKIKEEIDKRALTDAVRGGDVPGAMLSNGGVTLQLRRA